MQMSNSMALVGNIRELSFEEIEAVSGGGTNAQAASSLELTGAVSAAFGAVLVTTGVGAPVGGSAVVEGAVAAAVGAWINWGITCGYIGANDEFGWDTFYKLMRATF